MMEVGDGQDQSVHRPKMAVLVAEAIIKDICRRRLEPGMLLTNETQMRADLSVGRGTLREALRLLEAQGVIRVRPGRSGGPVVQSPHPEQLAQLLSVILHLSRVSFDEVIVAREVLEPSLAARAAACRDEDDLKRIWSVQAELEAAADDPDESGFMAANRGFHTALARAAKNRTLFMFWAAISAISDGQVIGVHYDRASRELAVRAHIRIAGAIEAQNSTEAERVMAAHVHGLREYLESNYRGILHRPIEVVSAH